MRAENTALNAESVPWCFFCVCAEFVLKVWQVGVYVALQ